ncbi:MAG: 2,3-bisphosphoglycerate-independent phosphoglycerate mutase [Candidatus Aminicenantes bacterium]|nr:2,3-bisphosphoglycerate-independent phosphoglycerate mutase [Candidatus Aminicenantes bacterium]
MNWFGLARELTVAAESKIILLVIDGLGDLPHYGRTPLETAQKPHLDQLALQSACGLTDPIYPGITPGSGPAHLALFGYDPLQYRLGRGILEALGSDVSVGKRDLVARGNFATLKDNLVVDRRAGRISTEETARLCLKLNNSLRGMAGARFELTPGKEHRFVFKVEADGLTDLLGDADPQKNHLPPVGVVPLAASEVTQKTADLVNAYIKSANDILKDEPAANTILLRGFARFPDIPPLGEIYKLRAAAVAAYPMYRGLAKLVGMNVLSVGPETENLIETLERHYKEYDFFYVHYKKADAAGEDGAFEAKVRAIEEIDRCLPRIAGLRPDVLAVTSDHSTPCSLKGHSWHPNPFLLSSRTALSDRVTVFTERECSLGILGRFPALEVMPLLLAHAGRLKKFGA